MTATGLARSAVDQVAEVAARHAADNDAAARFPTEALDSLRTSGLLGCLVPTEYGGLGGTAREMADISYQLARHCTSVARRLLSGRLARDGRCAGSRS